MSLRVKELFFWFIFFLSLEKVLYKNILDQDFVGDFFYSVFMTGDIFIQGERFVLIESQFEFSYASKRIGQGCVIPPWLNLIVFHDGEWAFFHFDLKGM